ncbi:MULTISPECIES: hypothetical protein [unclassified Streptomyces]|uniref:hypothetical protein n=1 Tax=unclassified Streptomyces TaxID=2593676 RepID=UPI002F90D1A9|nr:hypothetical protein OG832_44145 [Streptomyces sp. NBC_00826]WTB60689.1 hypothetical protein OG832_47760 [Streptomyces sp. NBC_00826]
MPRRSKKPRRLVADGRVYMWTMRHRHGKDGDGRPVDCRQILTLSPVGSGGPLRIVFADGPGRYIPGVAPMGSGDVGPTRGESLNLHEPGAVRALLDVALARGWQPGEQRAVDVDGWTLLKVAAAVRAGEAGPASA